MRWIPLSERLPETDKEGCSKYILLSFSNFTVPCVGRYEVDKDGSGAFYVGDDEIEATNCDLIVNAWMPLPKPYREDEQ